jgi:hypothetical protein
MGITAVVAETFSTLGGVPACWGAWEGFLGENEFSAEAVIGLLTDDEFDVLEV